MRKIAAGLVLLLACAPAVAANYQLPPQGCPGGPTSCSFIIRESDNAWIPADNGVNWQTYLAWVAASQSASSKMN